MNIEDEFFVGNCIEILKQFPDDSVDMIFADPPFNLGKKYTNYIDSKSDKDYLYWSYSWLNEIPRILKQSGTVFIHNIPKWLFYYATFLSKNLEFKNWIVWETKTCPTTSPLQATHYGILYFVKDLNKAKKYKLRYPQQRCRLCNGHLTDYGGKEYLRHPFGPAISDVWFDIHRIAHKKYRDNHPCQLPVQLVERLILLSSDAGDLIVDPFIGTGTTAIACKHLGRKFIGIDISEDYIKIAKDNIKDVAETKVGDCFVSFNKDKIVTIRDCDWEYIEKLMMPLFADIL